MISKQEIMKHAGKYSLPANTIEKDYVLNWLLAGIATSNLLKDKWIFKGGTCLKKCYFEEYRFSEDLDFTITDPLHIDKDFLNSEFIKIGEWIYENSGIEILSDLLRFEEYDNKRGHLSVQGKVAYRGPMQRRGSNPTVKLDLSCDEIVVGKPVEKRIHHPYTDLNNENISILTYCIEEIFAEKIRALTERMRPRDLYDVIHLHLDKRWSPNKDLVLESLTKKCAFKGIDVPSMTTINSHLDKQDLIADWHDMLAHQIANLEPYERYWK